MLGSGVKEVRASLSHHDAWVVTSYQQLDGQYPSYMICQSGCDGKARDARHALLRQRGGGGGGETPCVDSC
jgi:hypothetical protein